MSASLPSNPFLYLGGVSGVVTVPPLQQHCAAHLLALHDDLHVRREVFTGVLLDILLTGAFSAGNAAGGVLVTLGLLYMLRAGREERRGLAPL